MLAHFQSARDLKDKVRELRCEARAEARRNNPNSFLQSRGAYIRGFNPKAGDWMPEPNTWEFDGTEKQMKEMLEYATQHGLTVMIVEGGFDAAPYMQGFRDGEYEPWVSEWSVPVWGE